MSAEAHVMEDSTLTLAVPIASFQRASGWLMTMLRWDGWCGRHCGAQLS